MRAMPSLTAAVVLMAVLVSSPAPEAGAGRPACGVTAGLTAVTAVTAECEDRTQAPESATRSSTTPFPRFVRRVSLACDVGTANAVGSCFNTAPCLLPDGSAGIRHLVHEREETAPGQGTEWTFIGESCLPTPTNGEVTPAVSETDVTTAFRELAWPKAELRLQPTGGTTLVNKNTHAHTTSPGPVAKDVTLLGQRVTIEATPTSWTWHWGDGTSDTTDHPGAPHPGAVTHAYRRATPVHPRVDVTYQGRYRLNGSAWQPLTNTHTVTGDPQPLEVREAISQLTR